MATTFIALQCYQCSTMQVKQQKKKSSTKKWTCVVCNEKQSVRKVFARGDMARDLREFVQSFNMSRDKSSHHHHGCHQYNQQQQHSPAKLLSFPDSDCSQHAPAKRRHDWTQYLDQEEDVKQDYSEGDDFGPKIVTELPEAMFKKPKLKNHASGSDGGVRANGGLYKPVFSKRNANNDAMSQGQETRKHQPAKVSSASKWNDYDLQNNKQRRTYLPNLATKASKWDAYIINEQDELSVSRRTNSVDQMGTRDLDVWETILDDQKVEDDVHPDFL